MSKLTMPYAHIKKKIPRELDRRVRLSDEQKADIVALYKRGEPIRAIARAYEGTCSRRLVQFVIFPERRERASAIFKQNRKGGKYYNKDKWRLQMRSHRRYKQSIKTSLV